MLDMSVPMFQYKQSFCKRMYFNVYTNSSAWILRELNRKKSVSELCDKKISNFKGNQQKTNKIQRRTKKPHTAEYCKKYILELINELIPKTLENENKRERKTKDKTDKRVLHLPP